MRKFIKIRQGQVILIAFLMLFPSVVSAIVYQVLPTDIPQGLPTEIKGKYRIIEHDRARKYWYVYDVNKWKKFVDKEFNEERIRMYPPIHQYLFFGSNWRQDVVKEPMVNVFINELATIIERDKPLGQPPTQGKQLSATEAESIVKKEFYPNGKQVWSFKRTEHNGGILVCAFNPYFPDGIGIWWAKGNKVYSVNGIAQSKTRKLELTVDSNINVAETFSKCKSLR